VIEEGVELGRNRVAWSSSGWGSWGDNLPLVQRELLVMLVSRLLYPAERHAPGDVDGGSAGWHNGTIL
jgi:hypothetical protein